MIILFYYQRHSLALFFRRIKSKRDPMHVIDSLEDDVFMLGKNFSHTESEIKKLGTDVHKFVLESNSWLDARYEKDRYGFK